MGNFISNNSVKPIKTKHINNIKSSNNEDDNDTLILESALVSIAQTAIQNKSDGTINTNK